MSRWWLKASPLVLWLVGFAAAAAGQTAEDSGIELFVRGLRDNQVVFGEVEIEIEAFSEVAVTELVIRLDGEEIARFDAPPYRLTVDLGEDNVAHIFEMTASGEGGVTSRRTIVTGTIAVNEQLDVELQQLYVTVTRGGAPLLDLAREDFAVFDNQLRQRMVTFERGDVPLTAVLLIDSSLSMEGDALRAALAGARAFVAGMRELDEARVLVFSDRLLASTPFTGDPGSVSAVMDTVEAAGGTAINDHLFLALKQLDREPGRQVIVLLSDGLDVESVLGMADVEWKAGRMQSLIYWIRPSGAGESGGYFSVWRDGEAYRQELETLERVVLTSGGRIREIGRIEDAAAAFREILQELREQYVLGYYPSDDRDDGAWHDVKVRVDAPGTRVRARGGYFDDRM